MEAVCIVWRYPSFYPGNYCDKIKVEIFALFYMEYDR